MSAQKNAYFANSPNTSHRLRLAPASLRKATSRPAFDEGQGERQKGRERKGKHRRKVFAGWVSLSSVLAQARLLRPECVCARILMLKYLSTLCSKPRRFLFRPQNVYFANSLNTSHRLRAAPASLRKATPCPVPDGGGEFFLSVVAQS